MEEITPKRWLTVVEYSIINCVSMFILDTCQGSDIDLASPKNATSHGEEKNNR